MGPGLEARGLGIVFTSNVVVAPFLLDGICVNEGPWRAWRGARVSKSCGWARTRSRRLAASARSHGSGGWTCKATGVSWVLTGVRRNGQGPCHAFLMFDLEAALASRDVY